MELAEVNLGATITVRPQQGTATLEQPARGCARLPVQLGRDSKNCEWLTASAKRAGALRADVPEPTPGGCWREPRPEVWEHGKVLSEHSPLKQLPNDLEQKQFSFLVGIRYCIESIDLAYGHLKRALLAISDGVDQESVAPAEAYVSTVTHAWSMVDSVNRLHVLLDHMPRVRKSDPRFQELIRRLRQFENLRNPIQHLDSELNERARQDDAVLVWGAIAWSF